MQKSITETIKVLKLPEQGERPAEKVSRHWPEEWQDGAPPQITPALLQIDLRIYRCAKCSKCQKRLLTLQPQHNGQNDYRIRASCRGCLNVDTF